MTNLGRLGPAILEYRCGIKTLPSVLRLSNDGGRQNSPSKNRPMVSAEELSIPQTNVTAEIDETAAPTTCCMSGCANCVWIQYAEMLSEKLQTSEEDVQKIIMEKVQDPNMRAFLSMELRCRNLGKS